MDRLQGKDIVLATLSREDCRTLWRETEYDFEHPTEQPYLGQVARLDELQERR